ncbi:MAG: heavy metal translocating P-type ATPase metal-binding domain-containing protein [Burkholderiales bacterium]|nr:heavy metal translocating P-type ATPase metal-binding domain-containing protein [Burkholderiales bacterium]
MRVDKAVTLHFAGQDRLLCCYGCHAILHTVQKNNLVDTYLSAKAGQEISSA